ncbi:hypothetical protein [Photobacterium lutimaris]|uniref:Lipoprotein n=1 Tax=Photobacterium lutimaris TaxID=388278 RepID=A0A2T3J4H6_9GAMM|nr:hypothetical protein [Photobacterium lutimaris]PSU36207.1 hypothetical protein C9I99_04190 [Photobacterium lutimaris]TDR74922.1 hypothetical protein DFP78_106253 [Photobacterium lutimaris]
MNKLITASLFVSILSGCAGLAPVDDAVLPQNATYTGEGMSKLMQTYTLSSPVEGNNDLGMCMSMNVQSQVVSFSGSSYKTGPLTGNVYAFDTTDKQGASKNMYSNGDVVVMTEQVKNVFTYGGIVSYSLKHDIAAKYEDGVLKMKFYNLDGAQSDTGSIGNSGFSGVYGVQTWISDIFWGSKNHYDSVFAKVAGCMASNAF